MFGSIFGVSGLRPWIESRNQCLNFFFRHLSCHMTHGRITLKDDYVGGVYYSHEENMFFGFYDKKSYTSVV